MFLQHESRTEMSPLDSTKRRQTDRQTNSFIDCSM